MWYRMGTARGREHLQEVGTSLQVTRGTPGPSKEHQASPLQGSGSRRGDPSEGKNQKGRAMMENLRRHHGNNTCS